MELPRSASRLIFLSLFAALQSGCAVLFARNEEPDLRQVSLGASRDTVEAQLGEPIAETRTDIGQPGGRKCVYKVLVRAKAPQKLSTAEKVADQFVGFKTFQYVVIYDRSNHVLQIREGSHI